MKTPIQGLLRYGTVIVMALAALWASEQTAHSAEDHVSARELQQAGKIMSLDQILRGVEMQQSGKIIEAELHRSDGRLVYEIEFLDNHGRVHELYFDARTGSRLSPSRDD